MSDVAFRGMPGGRENHLTQSRKAAKNRTAADRSAAAGPGPRIDVTEESDPGRAGPVGQAGFASSRLRVRQVAVSDAREPEGWPVIAVAFEAEVCR